MSFPSDTPQLTLRRARRAALRAKRPLSPAEPRGHSAPTWQAFPVLVGPFDKAWLYTVESQRRPGRIRRQKLPWLYEPRYVQSAPPSVKRLRGVLLNALVSVKTRVAAPDQFLGFAWHTLAGADPGWVLSVQNSGDSPTLTAAAQSALRRVGQQLQQAVQRLRQRSVSNGRYWPAPQSVVLAFKPDGRAVASMAFAAGYLAGDAAAITVSAAPGYLGSESAA